MKNIKLCVFDLDGTLLNSQKIITENSLKAIKKLSENNIKFTIATGRIDMLARKYQKEIGSDLPIISCNGSIIRDLKGKIYYMKVLEFNKVKEIFQLFSSLNLHFLFYTESLILSTRNNPRIKLLESYNNSTPEEYKFKFEFIDDNIDKFSNLKFLKALAHIDDRQKLLKTKDILEEKFKELSIVSSDYELLDLMPSGVTKGGSLSILCDILNIKSDEVCVFGDNFNDLEMIKFAKTSIVPENGEEELKKICTYITKDNDNEGIAHAINEIILKSV